MKRALVGPRLAISWLTVFPVHGPPDIGRTEARKAIAATPLIGLVLGAIAAALLWGSTAASLNGLLAGLLTVGALALITRGMHIDGLADTADGLGCYGPPERAREVMHSGSAGPFGVAAVALVLAIQATGFGALAVAHSWGAVVLAVATGRVAVVLVCRRGIEAATPKGFGALVAGTQSLSTVVLWCAAAVTASMWAVEDRWWQGPVVLVVALGAAEISVRHCTRRFGGMSGDVLGAVLEATTTIAVIGFLLGG